MFLSFLSFINSIFNSSKKTITAHAYLLHLYSSVRQVAMDGNFLWVGGDEWRYVLDGWMWVGVVTRFSITHNYNSNEHKSIKIINSEKTETIWDEYR